MTLKQDVEGEILTQRRENKRRLEEIAVMRSFIICALSNLLLLLLLLLLLPHPPWHYRPGWALASFTRRPQSEAHLRVS
jgi:hypothetical protein